MPALERLRDAGFAIWPFDAPRWPLAVEIYPRLLTGAVNKGSAEARSGYLAERYPTLTGEMVRLAASSEDAFDAAISALAMDAAREELLALPPVTDRQTLLEGQIWAPAAAHHSNGAVRTPSTVPAATASAPDLETWRTLIRSMLPPPVAEQDDHTLLGGEPGEVLVELSPEAIRVSQYVSRSIAPGPRPAAREVARFDPRAAKPRDVARAIARTRGRRLGAYRWCADCRAMQPPEWMFEAELCQECAVDKHRIVF
jgi:hypothetical protein